MRADMRKPSSLISWSHCSPDGAVSTDWQSWGGIQLGSGDVASSRARGPLVLMAPPAERLAMRDMSTLSDEEHAFRLHVMIHDN